VRAPQHVAALLAAMPQAQERALGEWQAELAEWPGLWISAHGAATALADAIAGLEVDTARMRANIDALQGLVCAEALTAAFAREIGKPRAHALVEQLSRRVLADRRSLREAALEALAGDPALRDGLGADALDALFDIDAAARRAGDVARPQLAALRRSFSSPLAR